MAKAGNTAQFAGKVAPPPLHEWSQTDALLAEAIEEIRALRIVTVSANSRKGAKKPEFTRVLRPISVLQTVLKAKRYENHYRLRDRVLPHLRKKPPTEEPPAAETPKESQRSWAPGTSFTRRR